MVIYMITQLGLIGLGSMFEIEGTNDARETTSFKSQEDAEEWVVKRGAAYRSDLIRWIAVFECYGEYDVRPPQSLFTGRHAPSARFDIRRLVPTADVPKVYAAAEKVLSKENYWQLGS